MAYANAPEQLEFKADDATIRRTINKNFDDMFQRLNILDRSVEVFRKFYDVRGVTIGGVIYRHSEHAIQLGLTTDETVTGTEDVGWDDELRKDNDYFAHDNSVDPENVEVKIAGDYRITIKGVADEDLLLRVIRTRDGVDTAIDISTTYLGV